MHCALEMKAGCDKLTNEKCILNRFSYLDLVISPNYGNYFDKFVKKITLQIQIHSDGFFMTHWQRVLCLSAMCLHFVRPQM